MSIIAVQTSPESAITNIDDLIAEIRDEMDDDAYSESKIKRAITRAEGVFNRLLRTPLMETQVALTVAAEQTDLPLNFLQLRTIYEEASPDNPLQSLSPAGLRKTYRGRSGSPCAYAIENRKLIVAPVGEASLTVVYYAAIPHLTDNNPVNWLLDEHPDLYLHQCLAILFNKTGDIDRAAINLGQANSIIEQINRSARSNRYGAGPLSPTGLLQVPGTRV
jgi:hypothetical protein